MLRGARERIGGSIERRREGGRTDERVHVQSEVQSEVGAWIDEIDQLVSSSGGGVKEERKVESKWGGKGDGKGR